LKQIDTAINVFYAIFHTRRNEKFQNGQKKQQNR